jgi:hypothetical protein
VERVLGLLNDHALDDRRCVPDVRWTPLDPFVRDEELDNGRRQWFGTST